MEERSERGSGAALRDGCMRRGSLRLLTAVTSVGDVTMPVNSTTLLHEGCGGREGRAPGAARREGGRVRKGGRWEGGRKPLCARPLRALLALHSARRSMRDRRHSAPTHPAST